MAPVVQSAGVAIGGLGSWRWRQNIASGVSLASALNTSLREPYAQVQERSAAWRGFVWAKLPELLQGSVDGRIHGFVAMAQALELLGQGRPRGFPGGRGSSAEIVLRAC